MAIYADYEKEHLNAAKKQYDSTAGQYDTIAKDTYNEWEKGASAQHNTAKDAVNKQIADVPGQYSSVYDTNAVRELVGRRQLSEAMANAGLTDSGLSLANQTAISMTRGNADAAARLKQQADVDKLSQSLAQLDSDWLARQSEQKAALLNDAQKSKMALLESLNNAAVSAAASRYGTDTSKALAQEQLKQQKDLADMSEKLERDKLEESIRQFNDSYEQQKNQSGIKDTVVKQQKVDIDKIAREVIRGDWGNGQDRKNRLAAAGYDAKAVQDRVNQLLK